MISRQNVLSKESFLIALKFRDYRLLWFGMLISVIGSQMQLVTINWHIYLLTKSTLSLGIVGLVSLLPMIILSPFTGSISDIFNRKKIMLIAQVIMTLCAIGLAISTITNTISPIIIYLFVGINSMASTLDRPARQALMPLIVPKEYFMNAISLNVLLWQLAGVVGPAIGGVILGSFNPAVVYVLNAISFFSIIIAVILIKPQPAKLSNDPFSWMHIKEGLSYTYHNKIIFSTTILDFFATFFASATVLMPVFAKDILLVGPKGLGFLYAAPAIGGIIGGLISAKSINFRNKGRILLLCVLIYGFATIIFGISKFFYLSLLILVIAGLCDSISMIIRNTVRQMITPDYIRGRMTAINMIFNTGGPQLGELEAGVMAHFIGTPMSTVAGGIGTILVTAIIAKVYPVLRDYQ